MKKTICLIIALLLFSFSANAQVCSQDEKCTGVIINGACSGECVPIKEESCSLLSFSVECIVGKLVDRLKDDFEEFLNKTAYLSEHNQLNEKIIEILKKYVKTNDDLAGLDTNVQKQNLE